LPPSVSAPWLSPVGRQQGSRRLRPDRPSHCGPVWIRWPIAGPTPTFITRRSTGNITPRRRRTGETEDCRFPLRPEPSQRAQNQWPTALPRSSPFARSGTQAKIHRTSLPAPVAQAPPQPASTEKYSTSRQTETAVPPGGQDHWPTSRCLATSSP